MLDSELEDAFMSADQGMTKQACSSTVESVTMQRRLSRRRLQRRNGGTSTMEFMVISNQMDTAAMYQTDTDANTFLGAYNSHPAMQNKQVVGK